MTHARLYQASQERSCPAAGLKYPAAMGRLSLLLVCLLPASLFAAPLDLAAALDLARAQNEQVQQAAARVAQAEAAVDAAWAAIYPTIGLQATWRINDREIFVGERRIQRRMSVQGLAALDMQLVDFSRIGALDPAEIRADAAAAQAEWQTQLIDFAVADAWYATVAGISLRQAAERSLNSAEENLEVVRVRRKVGKALAVDEARAELRVVTAREDLTRALNVEASTRDLLGLLVGAPDAVSVAMPPALVVEPADLPPREAPVEEAYAQAPDTLERPDLQALSLLGLAAETVVENAWFDFLPTLSLRTTWQVSSDPGFAGQYTAGALFLTAAWALYDPNRAPRHASQQAIAEQARLEAQYREREARFTVRQAQRDRDTVAATLITARQRLALANEARRQVHGRYKAGRATALELVEAEDTLRQAELDAIARSLAVDRARLALQQALGLDPLSDPDAKERP